MSNPAVNSDINIPLPLTPSNFAHEGTKKDLQLIFQSIRILQQELSAAKARILELETP